MLLDFQSHFDRRRQRSSYRAELVEKILAYNSQDPEGEREGSLYLEHVKNGFPVHILENILQRLERKVSNQ